MKILLVEDSRPIRLDNQKVLVNAGYEVICAEDGEAALKMAREQRPDLILLDMILPKMSGPAVLGALKNAPATANIPVVVLSGLPEKNRQKLIDAGAEEYLEKSQLLPAPGLNLLPQTLENVVSRINRKRSNLLPKMPPRK